MLPWESAVAPPTPPSSIRSGMMGKCESTSNIGRTGFAAGCWPCATAVCSKFNPPRKIASATAASVAPGTICLLMVPTPSSQCCAAPGNGPCHCSLDHLVRQCIHLPRDFQPQRVGGLAVDHELQPRRLLDRQLAGLGALEDAVDEEGGAAVELEQAFAVAHQAAGGDVFALREHRRQAGAERPLPKRLPV